MTNVRLTDLQSVLLSAASQSQTGSLIPVPASITTEKQLQVRKALCQLLTRGFIAETDWPAAGAEWRKKGELRFGLVLTEHGRTVLGARAAAGVDTHVASPAPVTLPRATMAESISSSPAPTKIAAVIALMGRNQGATVADLIAATGWLPHTTRAALTGLRKKGHSLIKGKRGDATCYTIARATA